MLSLARAARLATTALAPWAVVAASLSACFGPGGNAASHLATAPTYDPAGQTKCGVKKSADHPLVVEWPSADRATLEAKAQSGLVAVRYTGCEMEVLHRCKLPGKYVYTAITPKHDAVTIRDADELYATMPVGAAKLEGTLAKSGQLDVSMTIVGRYDADHTDFPDDALASDDCARATHVVSGLTTGAFELSSGADAHVGGGVALGGAGAGGKSSASRETLERDGHEDKCEGGAGARDAPPDGCGAVIRVDVVPLAPPKRAAAPAVVGVASDDAIAPALYLEGNVRVAVACAERALVTPETGLRVLVDGSEGGAKTLKSNFVTSSGTQNVGGRQVPVTFMNYTDVGYLVPPGAHHLRVESPDCAALETDVVVSGTHAITIAGAMEVSNDTLRGPLGAPSGGSFLLGGAYGTMPSAIFNPSTSAASYTGVGTPSTYGALLGFGFEHRYFAGAFNYFLADGSYSGVSTSTSTGSAPAPFTGSAFMMMTELRLGARLPYKVVALSGGAGLGGSMWIETPGTSASGGNSVAPNGVSLFWHVPLWAAVDLKPFCNWGVQIGGAYNVQPTAFDGSYLELHAGIMWQPSPSCEVVPGVSVSP